ncbi:hypothetical protein AnigIFM63309_001101 [Aspergillus niger]|nr:hypothetical protein AnigIFM63309_001101 [Aspergillus niger]
MPDVRINGHVYDPITSGPPAQTTENLPEKPESILIQLKNGASLGKPEKRRLKSLGVHIQEYVCDGAYICKYDGSDLSEVRRLKEFICAAYEYRKEDTINKDLSNTRDAKTCTVDITFHDQYESNDKIKNDIATAAGVPPDKIQGGLRNIRLTVKPQALEKIAALSPVRYIEPHHPAKLYNDSSKVHQPLSAGDVAYDVKSIIGASDVSYKGKGQVIAVADSGFDKGKTDDIPEPFRDRVKKLYALKAGKNSPNRDPSDTSGHGTHVCGIALGKITSDFPLYASLEAPACEAELVMQSIHDTITNDALNAVPADLYELFKHPYHFDNARIHTNSWGHDSMGNVNYYSSNSRRVDEFVRENEDMVICFAAGNHGQDSQVPNGEADPKTIYSTEAVAKNCITVGASENCLPNIKIRGSDQGRMYTWGTWYGQRFPNDPIKNRHMAWGGAMAALSSRGPTEERRYKPDVVAPGTAVLSVRSRLCEDKSNWGISDDKNLMFMTGTSMATPLVASCCAVVRQALIECGTSNPSAALIKALIINGATRIPGHYKDILEDSPNSDSGFGLVNLNNSLVPINDSKEGGFSEATLIDDLNIVFEKSLPVPPDVLTKKNVALKVTLAYSDLPVRHSKTI